MRLSLRLLVPSSIAPIILVALPGVARAALAPTAAPQERDWVVLPLPMEDATNPSGGPSALFDGRHLFLTEDVPSFAPTLGPLLTGRSSEELVWGAVEAAPGGGGTVEPLGDAVLVRGPIEARRAGSKALEELRADLDALRFDVRARLVAVAADGSRSEVVLDGVRRSRTGAVVSFGRRNATSFVADFDVEVANEMAIADPVIGTALTGETVHLWPSSYLDGDGRRRVFVQGLLDVAAIDEIRTFDPDVFELGPIDQPVLASTQVLFSGAVPSAGALRVELAGLAGDLSGRALEISVVPRESVGAAEAIVDLGRGLWREKIQGAHSLFGKMDALTPTAGPTPSSLAQLFFNTFRRDRSERPVLGEALIFVDAKAVGLARELRSLAGELDPLGRAGTCEVHWGGFTALMPATEGALVRVARTWETSYVVDYDPQVAATAALSDPKSVRITDGLVVEGVVQGGIFVGRGVLESVEVARIREATPVETGRIQLPVRTRVPFPLRLQPGEQAQPVADLSVHWTSGGANELPR